MFNALQIIVWLSFIMSRFFILLLDISNRGNISSIRWCRTAMKNQCSKIGCVKGNVVGIGCCVTAVYGNGLSAAQGFQIQYPFQRQKSMCEFW